jgi:AcrR family transcriptional regulator
MPDTEPARRAPGRPSTGVREAIVTAALDLIADRGLARLTTREVAKRASVSEASVFYHFGDKIGLLQAVILAGLEPLKALDPNIITGNSGQPPAETLLQIATALESFFDHVLPVLEAVQADADLRAGFAERLREENLGPHRGVRLLSEHLASMVDLGQVRADADSEAAALLLVGACFLRAWLRHLSGPPGAQTLPALDDTVGVLAQLLAPPSRHGAGPGLRG